MFEFLATAFTRIVSLVASITIAVGLVSAPAEKIIVQDQVEVGQAAKQSVPIAADNTKETTSMASVEPPATKPVAIAPAPKSITAAIQTPVTTKTITLPNGSVVEVDVNGNVIRTIKEALQQIYSTQTIQNPLPSIQILDTMITNDFSSVRMEWKTNIPSESKLFLRDPDGTPHVYSSAAGLSTRHFVSMTLVEGLTFTYEIEAIAYGDSVTRRGEFKTDKRIPTTLVLNNSNPKTGYGGNCVSVSIKVGVRDQTGKDMPGVALSFFDPEISQFSVATTTVGTDESWATFTYRPQAFNTTKYLNFFIGDPPVTPSIMVTLEFKNGLSLIQAFPSNYFIQESSTLWRERASGVPINPQTGICSETDQTQKTTTSGGVD